MNDQTLSNLHSSSSQVTNVQNLCSVKDIKMLLYIFITRITRISYSPYYYCFWMAVHTAQYWSQVIFFAPFTFFSLKAYHDNLDCLDHSCQATCQIVDYSGCMIFHQSFRPLLSPCCTFTESPSLPILGAFLHTVDDVRKICTSPNCKMFFVWQTS